MKLTVPSDMAGKISNDQFDRRANIALDVIRKFMTRSSETLSVAECPIILPLQSLFSKSKNATDYFHGGISLHELPDLYLKDPGDSTTMAVDSTFDDQARQIAAHVSNLFHSDWGLGVIAYVEPVFECQIRRTLCIHYAIVRGRINIFSNSFKITAIPMRKVEALYVLQILKDLAKHVMMTRHGL